ncbi:hypothetical protein B0I35DRAFT_69621 [Stachybotrys elegans]|uniref:C2H2-type domain-containing protein n=1 Tax=Stachybotrys elegans TaxID=80388 RepID=A0A8K0SPV1_9HYPO|nr:hypothetical protein B0I35DRAFT_69621 [Stachybotrys elegans]
MPQFFGPGSRSQSVDSINDEDPLVSHGSFLTTPGSRQNSSKDNPSAEDSPSKSRIAVVLKDSPSLSKASPVVYDDSRHRNFAAPELSSTAKKRKLSAVKETLVPPAPTVDSGITSASAPFATGPSSRGRPKGWRPGMTFAEARANPSPEPRALRTARPQAASTEQKKRRGRPPKAPSPPPAYIYHRLNPPRMAFICEWASCDAELQNLETLRRHVYIVHHQRGASLECRWGRCGRRAAPRVLPNPESFKKHVERAHLVPLSWHAGDGPCNTHVSCGQTGALDSVPDFLKDAEGNQVTPWVRDQELEDPITYKKNRRKLKELLIRRNENLPDEESSDEMDENPV